LQVRPHACGLHADGRMTCRISAPERTLQPSSLS
jgi:hypothetical protein